MPLLMCPNCNSGMREVDREGVKLDMCPQCQGVWLDRGELQRLLDVVVSDFGYAAPPPQQYPPRSHNVPPAHQYPPQPGWHRKHDDSDDPYYKQGRYGQYRKKSTLHRIFDMFGD